jgi:superfamily II DNA or RNA helicase
MPNPAYVEQKKKRQPTYGLDPTLKLYTMDRGDFITMRGFLAQLREILQGLGITPEKVIEERYAEGMAADFGAWNEAYSPRGEQPAAIDALVAANGIVEAPAGAGKTLIGMKAIHTLGRCSLWIAHTRELVDQAVENARKYLPGVGKVGTITEGTTTWGDGKLIVAMIHMLDKNTHLVDKLNDLVGVVMTDEAHHFPAAMFERVISRFAARHMKGVTATTDRKDRLEVLMYHGIGPKVYSMKRQDLYDAGNLIKPKVDFIYTDFEYEPASVVSELGAVDAGGEDLDYRSLLDALMEDEARAKLIAEKILDYAANNYQIVLADSIRYLYKLKGYVEAFAKTRWGVLPRITVIHGPIRQYDWRVCKGNEKAAQAMVEAGQAKRYRWKDFGEYGRWQVEVPLYTDAEVAAWRISDGERKARMGLLRDRKVDIVFATGQLVREGLDIVHLNVGHLTTPVRGDAQDTKNGASVEQAIGRIMRADPQNPNKKAYWLDYTDYQVQIFKDQYYSRRSVYKRLGIVLPKKLRTAREELDKFLGDYPW